MKTFKQSAIEFEISEYEQFSRSCASFESLVERDIDSALGRLDDLATAQSFCEFAKLPGTSPKCFLPRIVTLSTVGQVLVAVRLRTEMSPYTPFLELVARTSRITNEDIDELVATLSREFSELNPSFVRFAAGADSELTSQRNHLDRVVLASTLASVLHCDRDGVTVSLADATGATKALEFYERAHSLNSQLKILAALPEIEALVDAHEDGALWEIRHFDELAGYIVLGDRKLYSEHDVWVSDAIIDPSKTKQGIYSTALSLIAKSLASTRVNGWLAGAIHPSNTASIRAARRMGRDLVRHVYEVPI